MSPVVLNIEELTAILALAVKSNETTPGGTTTVDAGSSLLRGTGEISLTIS